MTFPPDHTLEARLAAHDQARDKARLDVLRREVDLRLQSVTRMRSMNLRHTMHAWQRRYNDPIAPYGLAFLYVQPGPQQWHVLSAATKLWLQGPEASDLPRLLFDLNELVTQESSNPDFDIRRDLANRSDDTMAPEAGFVGLGVSSLDTHTGSWAQVCSTVSRDGDIPGTIRVVLIDGTIVICERRGLLEFNALSLRATQPMGASTMDSLYPWKSVAAEDLQSDPEHGAVVKWMQELSLNLWRLDNQRLAGAQRKGGPGADERPR